MAVDSALLLYDGSCGFCARSVQFVLRHDSRRRTLRFASLQSPIGVSIRDRHPELASIDSVIWYEPAEHADARAASAVDEPDATGDFILVRSRAVLRVLAYLGGVWSVLGALAWLVPRAIRDRAYDFVARNRHRLIRGAEACILPSPEERARFVDFGVTAAEIDAPR